MRSFQYFLHDADVEFPPLLSLQKSTNSQFLASEKEFQPGFVGLHRSKRERIAMNGSEIFAVVRAYKMSRNRCATRTLELLIHGNEQCACWHFVERLVVS